MTDGRRSLPGLEQLRRWLFGALLALVVTPALASGSGLVADGGEVARDAEDREPARATSADGLTADSEALTARLAVLDRYQASFTQTIRGARGELLERSSGTIRLMRPLFRWDVDSPYPQTIVAADGELNIYDPDLEQLIVRPLDEALADTPVALLTRDDLRLREDYDISRLADAAGDSYRLRPRDPEALFDTISLHFGAGTLIGLDILDHLGQETRIRFAPGTDAGALQPADFELEVPPGTDVLGG